MNHTKPNHQIYFNWECFQLGILQVLPPGSTVNTGKQTSKQSLEARKVCLSLSTEDP